jgi:hypothetical protein
MFRDKKDSKDEPIYKIKTNPQDAPDCRFCVYYWNNRRDYNYRDTCYDGYWLEFTELNENGSEKSFSRISTFQHGCKYFDVIVPQDQIPSLYIYRLIGNHCPMDISNSTGRNKNVKKEVKSESNTIRDVHDIDILA